MKSIRIAQNRIHLGAFAPNLHPNKKTIYAARHGWNDHHFRSGYRRERRGESIFPDPTIPSLECYRLLCRRLSPV